LILLPRLKNISWIEPYFLFIGKKKKKKPLNLGNKKENSQNARMKDDGPSYTRRAS
jgi:hypothetical protein